MNESTNVPNVPNNDKSEDPYKSVEFDEFLRQIGNASLPSWSIMAEALGVNRHTIERWRKHPLAKQALSSAIEENLTKMTNAGQGDWKMFREKLKMLGIKDKTVVEHQSLDEVDDRLEKERELEDDVVAEIKKENVEAEASLQNKE